MYIRRPRGKRGLAPEKDVPLPIISHSLPLPDIKHVPKPQRGALSLPCTCSLFPWALGPRLRWLWGPVLGAGLVLGLGPWPGPTQAPFLVRFGAVSDRCAAVFRRFEGFAPGLRSGACSSLFPGVAKARGLAKA